MNNVFLTRSLVGWLEREDSASIAASGRREAFLTLGAAGSVEETYRVADANLAEFAARRVQTEVAINAAGGVPFDDFDVADTINIDSVPHRVLNLSFAETRGTGRVTYTPGLNANVVLSERERIFNALRKNVRGVGLGRYTSAQPHVPPFADRLAIIPPSEVCETFTKADETPFGTYVTGLEVNQGEHGDASADLDWFTYWKYGNGLVIKDNELTNQQDSGESGFTAGGSIATVDDVTATFDSYLEFDYVVGKNNPNNPFEVGVSGIGYDFLMIASRATPDLFSVLSNPQPPVVDDFAGSGLVLMINAYGDPDYPDEWDWEIFDWNGSNIMGQGQDTPLSGFPDGHWRMEVVGDDVSVYLDDVLLDSATSPTPIEQAGKGFALYVESLDWYEDFSSNYGATFDNICAGDL